MRIRRWKQHSGDPRRTDPHGHPMRFSRWRALSLITVHLLIGVHVAHWMIKGRTLAPLELNEVMYTLELGVVTAGFLFMATLVLGTFIFGRFFCSWACHILALQDLSAWLLQRAGIRPAPIRMRLLRWVPLVAMLYMFVWPQLKRWIVHEWPGAATLLGVPLQFQWRIAGDAEGWASFVTTDFTRNLPGPWIAGITFLVCGFLVVYLLGSRSFCTYVCPYGSVFGIADRFAPGKIILAGECTACGICTAACQSRVRVQEEVLRYGKVVDPSCLKDLDCVAVCPTGALRWGFTTPSIVTRARNPVPIRTAHTLAQSNARTPRGFRGPAIPIRRPHTLALGEEVLAGASFVSTFLLLRGLYGTVPFLLALGASATCAFAAILLLRLARDRHARLGGRELRRGGSVTRTGRWFLVAAGVVALFLGHSGFIRYHETQSERQFRAIQHEDPRSPRSALLREQLEAHLLARERWGLIRPPELLQQLAAYYLHAGPVDRAEPYLRAMLERDPHDTEVQARLEWLLLQH